MSWENKSLSDSLYFFNGKSIKSNLNNGEIAVYGANGITGFTDKSLYKEAIIIGRVGAYCGAVKMSIRPFWPSDNTIVVKPIEGNIKFYYYLLSNYPLNKHAGGAAQPLITQTILKSLCFDTPNLQTQKKIADILSAYDDLIENNLKRIKLLEQAAQNIYKEWFVNMRFPGYESAEFDSATGLPVGWKKVNLYDIADIQMGYPFKAHQFNQEEKGNPVVRIRDIPKNFTETFTTESVSEKYRILNGDILIGMDGIFHIDAWSGQNDALLVQRVCRVKAYQSILHGYLLEALRAPISYFEQTISGATVAHLGAKHLKEIFVSIPSESTVTRLELFNKLLNQRVLLYKQNQKLKEARDILLPRLMNQTIDV